MKQLEKKGSKNRTGAIGEAAVAQWLQKRGFTIVETNYLKKWGEIDIVAHETDICHFIEVKTVSYETTDWLERSISHETWKPEDNVHGAKLARLGRTIQSWLIERRYTGNWVLDVAVVRLVEQEKVATIKMVENVVIGA